MRIALDVGHAGKTTHPGDRGAVNGGTEEVALVVRYLLAADRQLRELGHEVLLFGGLGSYADRIARCSSAGADVYVQGHIDAGLLGRTGDRGTSIYDHRSARGKALAESVATALGKVTPWPQKAAAGRPDDDGQARDEDLSEAWGCISACYALRPVGLLLEPGFIDGAAGAAWLREHVESVGVALAAGIHAWSRAL